MNVRSTFLRGFAPVAMTLILALPVASHAASLIPGGLNGEIGYTVTNTPALSNSTNAASVGGYSYNFIYSSLGNAVLGAAGYYGNVAMDAATGNLTPPATGGILALDSDFNPYVGPVSITFATTPGMKETVSFGYAGTQQAGYTGASTDQVTASAGGVVDTTPYVAVASTGATDFATSTFSFIANSASSTISFAASGTPVNNVPAFALVDNLTVTQSIVPPTPEPNSLILLGTGLAGLGGLVRSRFVKVSVKA